MRRLYLILVYLLILLSICLSGCLRQGPPPNTVDIKDDTFHPSSINVSVGTMVTWNNHDIIDETVTSSDGKFDSGSIPKDHGFSYTFLQPGIYEYYSKNNQSMRGVVVVTYRNGTLPAPESSQVSVHIEKGVQPDLSQPSPSPSDSQPPNSPQSTKSVEIKNFAFSPATVTVPAGTSITWTNEDSASHTVTSTDGKINSGILNQGKKFTYTFNDPGTYDYICGVHPYMKGTVIVMPSGNPQQQTAIQPAGASQPAANPAQVSVAQALSESVTAGPISAISPQPSTIVIVDLLAKNMNFDKNNITVIAGSEVIINFYNLDRGVPHNFAVYANSEADTVIFQGSVIVGSAQTTYVFNAPVDPGIYFFRCDVHPKVMTGNFYVVSSDNLLYPSPSAAPQSQPETRAPDQSILAASQNATMTGPQSIIVDLAAENIAFDKKTITVPAGAKVTINFNNRDSGVPHNFAVYTDSTAETAVFQGQIITGPAKTTYTFDAPAKPGTYLFRCDVHPVQMTGQFIVQAASEEQQEGMSGMNMPSTNTSA